MKSSKKERLKEWKKEKGTEYKAWTDMKQRCSNPNNSVYRYYGERDIKVCDRWIGSYENFLEDVGRKPSPEHSLDRIDNDGNYNPQNCRWATQTQQARNQRIRSTNTSGHSGINWHKANKRWVSRITANNKRYSLGSFENLEDAIEARRLGKIKYWKD